MSWLQSFRQQKIKFFLYIGFDLDSLHIRRDHLRQPNFNPGSYTVHYPLRIYRGKMRTSIHIIIVFWNKKE